MFIPKTHDQLHTMHCSVLIQSFKISRVLYTSVINGYVAPYFSSKIHMTFAMQPSR